MNIEISDYLQQLKFAKDDLQALNIIVTVVEDQKDWQNDKEMLAVIRRALEPIILDMEAAIDGIETELVTASDIEADLIEAAVSANTES